MLKPETRRKQRMNIVFINPEYPPLSGMGHGGIATYTYTLANALAKLGNRVHIINRTGMEIDSLHRNVSVHLYHVKPAPPVRRIIEKLTFKSNLWERGCSRHALGIIEQIRQKNPVDIVEVPEYNALAIEFSPPLPFPLVIHFHTPSVMVHEYNRIMLTREHRRMHALEFRALRNTSFYKATSISMKKEIVRRYGLDSEKIRVIYNPMSTEKFDSIKKERSNPDSIDILFAGRLEARKGAEILLNALSRILDIDPRINITFAGETAMNEGPNYRNAIERKLSADERKRVWFLGPINREALASLFCRSNIFLIPSLFDNAPNSLFEAMAARLPVIASDVGGINEIIRHEQNGLLFNPHSIDSLVKQIARYVEEPQSAQQYAEKAYEEVSTAYTPEAIGKQTMTYYESVKEQFLAKQN
jgi:glycosyltransferase involved in cell wall biosynthesis